MTVPLPADRPARLTVGVISAGRVGAVLGAALGRAGHRIAAVSAVSDASRRRAELLVPSATVAPPDEVASAASLLVLAVPDDELGPLVLGLANTHAVARGTLVVHTSGASGTEILAPLADAGALPLALHPAMTFTGTEVDLQRLDGAAWGVTAEEILRPVGEALVIEMGGEPAWIPPERRALYHAGLVVGANNLITLVTQSAALLNEAGVEHPERMLGPLLSASLDNALRFGDAGLTGPVARGDAETLREHLRVLARTAPEITAAYVAMARLTADRALAAGLLAPDDAGALLAALADGYPR